MINSTSQAVVPDIIVRYQNIRKLSETICAPLEIEDYVVQPIVDVSPPKWHLGHTTWFFEEFILVPNIEDYQRYDKRFAFVFNSYYESMGKRIVRTNRGNLSRPTVKEVYSYRKHVDTAIMQLLEQPLSEKLSELLAIGLQHEQQHQELLYTDIKYILGTNPLLPEYDQNFSESEIKNPNENSFISLDAGLYTIGHQSKDFCFDNELGVHQVYLPTYEIASRLITSGEYLNFMTAGGYQNPAYWHSEGWAWIQENRITAPMYWHLQAEKWYYYSLSGLAPLSLDAPVTHISYYEASAYAQWSESRLPTEFEWEVANRQFDWGARWEWTESAYLPYPGYKKAPGALGEYNGKFMVNQKVLRGGSVATSPNHTRATYRNFFHPQLRWQFTGIRLAK